MTVLPVKISNLPAWSQLWLALFRVCVEGEQRRFEPDLSSGCLTLSILVCGMRLNFGKVLADDSTPSQNLKSPAWSQLWLGLCSGSVWKVSREGLSLI